MQPLFNILMLAAFSLPKLDFHLSPDQIRDRTVRLIDESRRRLDLIGLIPAEQASFKTVFRPLAQLEADIATSTPSLLFPQYVHPDAAIREACIAATQSLDQFSIEMGMREDVFRAAKAAASRREVLDKEESRFVDKVMLGFRLNGLELDAEKRALLKEKREQLADAELLFSKAVNEDATFVLLTRQDLDGCPDDFLASLERVDKNDGQEWFKCTMKYPDLFGVLRNAKKAETRKAVSLANDRRCPGNVDLLAKAVRLRAECAQLLGFHDHCEFKLADRMAKTRSQVVSFLDDLKGKLRPIAEKELAVLKALKSSEANGTEFHSWDFHYYANQLVQRNYAVDHELLKEYFPMEHVVNEMLGIYEEVLSLKFKEIVDPAAPKWHPEARLFAVLDQNQGFLVGHIYLDMFPRQGKYTHAACFPLQPGYLEDPATGARQCPVSSMVCNFSKPLPGKPSLLKHDEVVTFFHELGHAMHGMCARTKFSRFHGTNTETDFVEAPSQMLENVSRSVVSNV